MTTYGGTAFKILKSSKSSLTGSAAIFTWIVLLNLSQVYAEGQRCYVCGPRSSHWYSNGTPPSCGDFKPEANFEVICGKGYDYCATIKTAGSHEVSRVCVETHEPRGCISKACAKTKTLFTVCSCSGTLCNGEPSSTTVAPDTPTQGVTTTTGKVQESHEMDTTTLKMDVETTTPKADTHEKKEESHEKVEDNVEEKTEEKIETKVETKLEANFEEHKPKTEEVENPPTEKPIKHEHENAIQNDEIHINKTRESKKERDLTNNVETHKQETVTTHSLPLPEALGQEHKKKNPSQGAPVDDEEDTVEGSGSKVEEVPKVHNNPTTHMSQVQATTTTKPPNNSAPAQHIITISLWTFITIILVS